MVYVASGSSEEAILVIPSPWKAGAAMVVTIFNETSVMGKSITLTFFRFIYSLCKPGNEYFANSCFGGSIWESG
jgi:hypothetical protein